MKVKIALDLGHGIGVDRGAVGIIEEEKIINEVGYLVYEKLENLGHEVLLVRPRLGITSLLQSLNYRTIGCPTLNLISSYLFICSKTSDFTIFSIFSGRYSNICIFYLTYLNINFLILLLIIYMLKIKK